MSDIYSAIVTDHETEQVMVLLYQYGQYHKPLAILDENDVSRLISSYIEFAEGGLVLKNKTMIWNKIGNMWRVVDNETGDTIYQGKSLKRAILYILGEVTA